MSERIRVENNEFKSGFEAILHEIDCDTVHDYAFFELPSNQAPWFDTGIKLQASDQLSSFAVGGTELKGTPIRLDPDFQLWFRVGTDGEILRGTRDAHSFTAEQSGRLYLASYFPGEWSTKSGSLGTPAEIYENAVGNLTVLLIRWSTDHLDEMKKIAKHGDVGNLIATEIDRLTSPILPPKGWNYLWYMGPAEIYQACNKPERESAICCHTHNDEGLLQKSVLIPLQPNTRLH